MWSSCKPRMNDFHPRLSSPLRPSPLTLHHCRPVLERDDSFPESRYTTHYSGEVEKKWMLVGPWWHQKTNEEKCQYWTFFLGSSKMSPLNTVLFTGISHGVDVTRFVVYTVSYTLHPIYSSWTVIKRCWDSYEEFLLKWRPDQIGKWSTSFKWVCITLSSQKTSTWCFHSPHGNWDSEWPSIFS